MNWKIVFLPIFIVLSEIILLRFLALEVYMPLRQSQGILDHLLGLVPSLTKSALITGFAGLGLSFVSDVGKPSSNKQLPPTPGWQDWRVNAFLFVSLGVVLLALRVIAPQPPLPLRAHALLTLSVPLWLGMLLSWALLIALPASWRDIWSRFRAPLLLVFAVSFASFYQLDALVGESLGTLLLGPTIQIAQGLFALSGRSLEPIGPGPDGFPMFKYDNFSGEIQPACSGYEGILLTIAFLSALFWQERHRLSPPLFVAVLAVAATTTFLLNALRIAVLFVVGANFSAEIAQNGFHTNFGVLSLALSVGGAYFALDRFLNRKTTAPQPIGSDATVRMLFPIILLTGSSLLLGLFTGKFYWLYPLQCAAGAAGIFFVVRQIPLRLQEVDKISVLIGFVVFLVWVAMVRPDPGQDLSFKEELFSAPPLLSALWLTFRFLGATVVVPVAEEFAFRGAFWTLLMNALPADFGRQQRALAVLLTTSVAFGLLHTDIYAGVVAGVAFGAVRLRAGRVEDAVVAHAVANFLLSSYILLTGYWSYW